MRVILELPDETSSLGLFINYRSPEPGVITTTNWLVKPEDNLILTLHRDTTCTTERKDESGV